MPFLKDKSALTPKSKVLIELSNKKGLRRSIYNVWNDRYIGMWKDNFREEKGACLGRTGRFYEGDWKKSFRDGFGVLCLPENNKFVLEYAGDWKKGRQCGSGQKHIKNEGYYLGNIKNSKRQGYGQMWYLDGGYYNGEWHKDLREGSGIWVRPDGNRYEGEWYLDFQHGKGKFYHLKTGQMQDGIWKFNTCIGGILIDIPYRQSVINPTPYPIPPIMLKDLSKETEILTRSKISCVDKAADLRV